MILLFTFLRLLFPLTIFRLPLFGGLLAVFIDCLDWMFVPHSSDYQAWDKLLDIYYLSIEAIVCFKFASKLVRNTAIVLFLLRLNGVILFFTADSKIPLFLFPNIFESLFVFCLLYELLTQRKFLPSRAQLAAVLAAIAVPKFIQEYAFHVDYAFPWDYAGFFSSGGVFYEFLDKGLWIFVYLSLPIFALTSLIRQRRIR